MLARGKTSYVCSSGYPLHDGLIWAPFSIQRTASNGRDIRSLRGLFQLGGVDDDSKMLLIVFVVVIQVKECRPVRSGYASAGHALHLDVVRRG